MSSVDVLICVIYLLFSLGLGITISWRRSRKGSDTEYFLAGRTMKSLPVGISVMVTAFSALNYLAIPSEVVNHGLYVTMAFPMFAVVAIPVLLWFIPFFHGRKQLSAYAFLEDTFDRKVRLLAAGMFIFIQLTWMALILYASGKMLGLLSGISQSNLIIIIACTSVVYVAIGGLRAVIWTDLLQFLIIIGSILVMLGLTMSSGLGDLSANLLDQGFLQPYAPGDAGVFEFDPSLRMSFWSVVTGTFFMFLVRYGADQAVLQRYAAISTLAATRKMFLANMTAVLVCLMTLAVFGLSLVHFAAESGLSGKPGLVVLSKLLKQLPDGLTGLVTAGLLAATMSSIDSGINAVTMTLRTDFGQRGLSKPNTRILQRFVWNFIVGAVVVCLSFIILNFFSQKSIFSLIASVVNALGGALLIVVIAGMLAPKYKCSSNAVFYAGLSGFVFSIAFVSLVTGLSLHFYIVVNVLVSAALLLIFEFAFAGVSRYVQKPSL